MEVEGGNGDSGAASRSTPAKGGGNGAASSPAPTLPVTAKAEPPTPSSLGGQEAADKDAHTAAAATTVPDIPGGNGGAKAAQGPGESSPGKTSEPTPKLVVLAPAVVFQALRVPHATDPRDPLGRAFPSDELLEDLVASSSAAALGDPGNEGFGGGSRWSRLH